MSRPLPVGRGSGERGFSLAEMLVALAVLCLATLVALTIYDEARRSFDSGENRAEQQQGVRIALDRLGSDLRMAGFNHNPDGNLDRPDEAIEAALATALVLRADFDGADPVEAAEPEVLLAAGGPFVAVPTANDEIVGYALAKPDGSSSGSLAFAADVAEVPRDGRVEEVTFDQLDLEQIDPPYTLYRFHVGDDGAPARTPMIDNVRRLTFRYYDGTGEELAPPGGEETEQSRSARAAIRRVVLEVEAMTRDPHPTWIDGDDLDPETRRHRKFRLSGTIHPRNVGRRGQRDLLRDPDPPAAPGAPTLHPGHCGGLYAIWPPNDAQDEVTYYRVRYGSSPDLLADVRLTPDSEYYLGGLPRDAQVYVAIEAVDAWGNASPLSPTASALTENLNTPERPSALGASTDLDGRVRLAWEAVTANTGPIPGDPESPLLRELAGYRVYRGAEPDFVPDAAHLIADEGTLGAASNPLHHDTHVVNCRTYTYRVRAVDQCGLEGDPGEPAAGTSASDDAPAVPGSVNAHRGAQVQLAWSAVSQDVDGDPIWIDTYELLRTGQMPAGSIPRVPEDFALLDTVSGTSYADSILLASGQTVFYMLRARDDCVNRSDFSQVVEPVCTWVGGAVQILSPHDGETASAEVHVHVTTEERAEHYHSAVLRWEHLATGAELSVEIVHPGPIWTYDYSTHGWPSGAWRFHSTVQDPAGCAYTSSIGITIEPPP